MTRRLGLCGTVFDFNILSRITIRLRNVPDFINFHDISRIDRFELNICKTFNSRFIWKISFWEICVGTSKSSMNICVIYSVVWVFFVCEGSSSCAKLTPLNDMYRKSVYFKQFYFWKFIVLETTYKKYCVNRGIKYVWFA